MSDQLLNARAEAAFADKERLGITDDEWSWAMQLACDMAANGSKLGAAVMLVESRREAVRLEREPYRELVTLYQHSAMTDDEFTLRMIELVESRSRSKESK